MNARSAIVDENEILIHPKHFKFKLIALLLFVLNISISTHGFLLAKKETQNKTIDSNSLFPVIQNGKWGYIDKTGKIVVEPQFDEAWSHTEGLAGAKIRGRWGYIDKRGKIVVEPQFNNIFGFSEGLAAIETGGKWGYIDKTGKIVINPQFDKAYSHSEGLARVKIGDKLGYIDKTGKYVWNPTN